MFKSYCIPEQQLVILFFFCLNLSCFLGVIVRKILLLILLFLTHIQKLLVIPRRTIKRCSFLSLLFIFWVFLKRKMLLYRATGPMEIRRLTSYSRMFIVLLLSSIFGTSYKLVVEQNINNNIALMHFFKPEKLSHLKIQCVDEVEDLRIVFFSPLS